MKRKKILTTVCILLLAYSNLYSFDGKRKGFILDGGIGTGYLSNSTSYNSNSNTDSRAVFFTELQNWLRTQQHFGNLLYKQGILVGKIRHNFCIEAFSCSSYILL